MSNGLMLSYQKKIKLTFKVKLKYVYKSYTKFDLNDLRQIWL